MKQNSIIKLNGKEEETEEEEEEDDDDDDSFLPVRWKSLIPPGLSPGTEDTRHTGKAEEISDETFRNSIISFSLWYFPVRGIRKILGGRKKFGASTSTIDVMSDKGTGITRQTLPGVAATGVSARSGGKVIKRVEEKSRVAHGITDKRS
ncbi:hypothetical protein RUM43_012349 [Polyplax serrata]|uniref:Uncharacterized protein n=1 Tax=Polyplax serrata TaxID=468196 RepID=A0AAN8PDH2_POLSC